MLKLRAWGGCSATMVVVLRRDFIENQGRARITHLPNYDALMDFLLEVDTLEKFTDTMEAEYSQ